MDKGKIIEEGSHLSLLANKKSVYKRLWNLQVKT
jgi:ABC-type multidrug transport system fused ATPase/permease subunit